MADLSTGLFHLCPGAGALYRFLPYPFIEVDTLGYPRMFINAVMVLLGFMGMSLVLVALDRWKGKRWGATAAVRPVTHRSGRVTLDVPRIG
ncbi:Pr6Pr family membrane protein [Pseudomonas sp. FP2300]|uniref:Pr6Pr family membrane protein n=1 Tax=Pseudomonas sp. FP2300 TaxID=2954090 RepID=UPI003521693D